MQFSLLMTGSFLIIENTQPDLMNFGKITEYLGLSYFWRKKMCRASQWQRSCCGRAGSSRHLRNQLLLGFTQPGPGSEELSGEKTTAWRRQSPHKGFAWQTSLPTDASQAAWRGKPGVCLGKAEPDTFANRDWLTRSERKLPLTFLTKQRLRLVKWSISS